MLVGFLTDSKSKHLLPEVGVAARASSLSIYNVCLLQAVPKKVLGAERRAQQTCRKRPGPDSSTGSRQGLGRLQIEGARVADCGWEFVCFSLCTPNKLRTFFFLAEIPWEKMGTGRVAGRGSPHRKVSYPGVPWRLPSGMRSELWELYTQILCLCMFSGTKVSFFFISSSEEFMTQTCQEPWCKYQIHLQTLQNEPIFIPFWKVILSVAFSYHLLTQTCCHF